jgi:hypothetical protein
MRAILIAALICAAWAPTVLANPYNLMFKSTSHDFGTVAKAAKTEHRFFFDNPYATPVHVKSVRTSCGCTTPIIETETVPSGGRGSILARFNTNTHSGARAATVTVTFDKPSFGEVQLHVKGYIRTDVVFQPGEVSFGTLSQGQSKEIQVVVDYAGRSDWQITHVRCDEAFIQIERKEKLRQNGRVQYVMNVRFNGDAPAGPLQSEIVLQTNDRNLTTVPLSLTAMVLSEISVTPNLLSLGDVSLDDSIKQLLVLKAQQPFKVLAIESEQFNIESNPLSLDAKTLHTLPLVLQPRSADGIGDTRGKIQIRTDREEKPLMEIDVIYRIKPQAEKAPVQTSPSEDDAPKVPSAETGANPSRDEEGSTIQDPSDRDPLPVRSSDDNEGEWWDSL